MPFQKGQPKSPGSGRAVGVTNKRTQFVEQILQAQGFCPTQHIMSLLETLKPSEQVDACLKLMEFMYPKKKATEITINDDQRKVLDELDQMKALPEAQLVDMAERHLQLIKKSG